MCLYSFRALWPQARQEPFKESQIWQVLFGRWKVGLIQTRGGWTRIWALWRERWETRILEETPRQSVGRRQAVASEMLLQSPPGEHTASVSSSPNLFQISLGPHGSSPDNTVSSPFSCPSFSPALHPHSFQLYFLPSDAHTSHKNQNITKHHLLLPN